MIKLKPFKEQIILPLYLIGIYLTFTVHMLTLLESSSYTFFEMVFRSIFWGYHFVIWVAPLITEGFIASFS